MRVGFWVTKVAASGPSDSLGHEPARPRIRPNGSTSDAEIGGATPRSQISAAARSARSAESTHRESNHHGRGHRTSVREQRRNRLLRGDFPIRVSDLRPENDPSDASAGGVRRA